MKMNLPKEGNTSKLETATALQWLKCNPHLKTDEAAELLSQMGYKTTKDKDPSGSFISQLRIDFLGQRKHKKHERKHIQKIEPTALQTQADKMVNEVSQVLSTDMENETKANLIKLLVNN